MHLAKTMLFAAFALMCAAQAWGGDTLKVVQTPPTTGKNDFYAGNRAPLLPSPLAKLPIGSIRPEGWLRHQMELMTEGFTGHLTELSDFCKFEGNAWVSPDGKGEHGWEEVPYWLKGYADLGYVLGDKRIIDESRKWIEGILSSQRPDGYFGPQCNRDSVDLWPNMLALHILRSFYEATGDKRVPPFLSRYFKWQMTLPLEKLLPPFWQKMRAGDNLDSIYWLYNITGEDWLLDAARVIHERTADWSGELPTRHGVNLGQGFREPAEYYQQTHDERYLRAAERNYDEITGEYGQAPGGGFGADENCRAGYHDPRQGTETCTWVELMWSHELLTQITGDPLWADRCEEVAFNSLPASMTPDLKALHYLTCPNQIQLDHVSKAPMIQNGGNMFAYDPYDFRCCQHNVAFGWPYFAEHLWMATKGNGLAAVLYASNSVTAKVASGTSVKITEETNYPFDEAILFTVSAAKPVNFPLCLRIPTWCQAPKIAVNDKALDVPQDAKGWALLERTWKNGDRVRLELPMAISVKTWAQNGNSVSVYRGPLAYSLKIGERWEKFKGTEKWPGAEVFPATPWNYGLVMDDKDPTASFEFVKGSGEVAAQPFTPDAAPVQLKAKGKRIQGWKQEDNGIVGEVRQSPVKSDEPTEDIALIPMGCARLRISEFPRIGEGPDAVEWKGPELTAEASQVGDSLVALYDEVSPKSSADKGVPRFTWWDHLGTNEWVQYVFPKPRRIWWVEVYWFDDTPGGGSYRVPASWRLIWRDNDKTWKPVESATEYGTSTDKFNHVEFKPVETRKLRIEVSLQTGMSGGILEWRFGE